MTPQPVTAQIATTPLLPRPPHDPLTLRLDGRVGWQAAVLDNVEIQPDSGNLGLRPLAASLPDVAEPSGSLGGVVLPAAAALGPRGDVYLLDAARGAILVFDPCCCRFDAVPCLGGIGKGGRLFNNPKAIAICNRNLLVTDSGNHRISVFSLEGFVLRDHWCPPGKEPFSPYGIAIDGKGRVFVTDPDNVKIHRFSPAGVWEKALPAPGVPRHLAVDCFDRLYVVSDLRADVAVLNGEGEVLGSEARADALAERFPDLPFPVLPGHLDLSSYCEPDGTKKVFDLQGRKLTPPPSPPPLRYPPVAPLTGFSGRYQSEPFDSELFDCRWHRVLVCACVPEGAALRFSTYTAATLFTAEDIDALPDTAWQTRQAMRASAATEWDCLIAGDAGRYLWLRIDFLSQGASTPSIHDLRLEFPRITLRRYLPAVFGENARSADFTDRFLAIFDTTLRSIETRLDRHAALLDPRSSPVSNDRPRTDYLTYIASWIGIAVDRNWPEQRRRDFVRSAAALYPVRGTPDALRQLLLAFLGMPVACCAGGETRCSCRPRPRNCAPEEPGPCPWRPPELLLEHFRLRRWLFVGSGRLGEDAKLWGASIVNRSQLNKNARTGSSQLIGTPDPFRDPFFVYAYKFSVFVPARAGKSETERRALIRLLNEEKPAHTQYQLEFVECRFRIGVQATIGLNSVVGRYPEGVTLNRAQLGRGAVLSSPPHRRGGPAFEVGRNARIGSSTALE